MRFRKLFIYCTHSIATAGKTWSGNRRLRGKHKRSTCQFQSHNTSLKVTSQIWFYEAELIQPTKSKYMNTSSKSQSISWHRSKTTKKNWKLYTMYCGAAIMKNQHTASCIFLNHCVTLTTGVAHSSANCWYCSFEGRGQALKLSSKLGCGTSFSDDDIPH